MNDLRAEITRVRDAYRGQMKFCDIEAFGYFREFVRRLDDALASVAGAREGQDPKGLEAKPARTARRVTPNLPPNPPHPQTKERDCDR